MDRTFSAAERDVDYALDRKDALAKLIDALPAQQRSAVRLFHFSGLSAREIAAQLGVSVERAGDLLARGERGMRNAARTRFPSLCMNGNGH
jgi:RNA polymerase sigma factor (sigma-70 family)